MGKSRQRHQHEGKGAFTTDSREAALDTKYQLYQRAVQAPKGDISYLLKFFRLYIGGREPHHLREDFCGTALVCVTWCKGDVFRTAVGLDLDPEPLHWGMKHNAPLLGGSGPSQLCLLNCNVLDDPTTAPEIPHLSNSSSLPAESERTAEGEDEGEGESEAEESLRSRPADIVCALNFGVCLLHRRSELLRYFQRVRAALSLQGGIFVADLLGGHAAEAPARLDRQNEVTGLRCTWEQGAFNPVTRLISAFITLKCPQTKQVLKHAFSYHWRLWTILDVTELLLQAGFSGVHVWLRPMKETGAEMDPGDSEEEEEAEEAEFIPYTAALAGDAAALQQLARGWTAYVVGVAASRLSGGKSGGEGGAS